MPATTATEPATGHRGADDQGFVEVNGLQLWFRETGPPEGDPIVLLHGIMGHGREWDVVVRALARSGRRVITLDQRGHGRSDWAGEYSIAALAGDLAGFLNARGLAGVTLIGHSMGGLAGSLCAADRPDLVRRLGLIDIGPDSTNSEWGQQELPPLLAAFAIASYQDESEAVAEWLAGDPLAREPLLRNYVQHALVPRPDGRLAWRFDAAKLVGLVTGGIDRQRQWQAIDRISCPTLLIRGEHSDLLSPAGAAEVVRRLGAGTLVEIPGGGHDLGVQQPEAVAVAVRSFLDR
jgi:pimeloyl-ACP methyl ester carboxylesterase